MERQEGGKTGRGKRTKRESQGDTATGGNRIWVMERTYERKREIGKLKHSTQTHPAKEKK